MDRINRIGERMSGKFLDRIETDALGFDADPEFR